MLDRDGLRHALSALGDDLAQYREFIEIAIYGGSAIALRYDWRRGTEDVDAVARPGYDEAVLAASVARVAARLGLAPDWLNDAVGMFTPLEEDGSLFDLFGTYPEGGEAGLRVLLATSRYLLAMKLSALASLDRGDRDMDDAKRLAVEVGIDDVDALTALYMSIHGEAPRREAAARFPSVVGGR